MVRFKKEGTPFGYTVLDQFKQSTQQCAGLEAQSLHSDFEGIPRVRPSGLFIGHPLAVARIFNNLFQFSMHCCLGLFWLWLCFLQITSFPIKNSGIGILNQKVRRDFLTKLLCISFCVCYFFQWKRIKTIKVSICSSESSQWSHSLEPQLCFHTPWLWETWKSSLLSTSIVVYGSPAGTYSALSLCLAVCLFQYHKVSSGFLRGKGCASAAASCSPLVTPPSSFHSPYILDQFA